MDILYLSADRARPTAEGPLAERIRGDMLAHGDYLSVRYWSAPHEMTQDQLVDVTIRVGLGEADVGHHYSDITGYLWTDEEVGGHDLIEELRSRLGSFCHLEIGYSVVRPRLNSPTGVKLRAT
jgi:hypothetical protein